ncbi:MAG: NfeD family protein [Epsilonproteobacteria bacterium]|nr:NfeD family protein [Campylobacterota bacterium]
MALGLIIAGLEVLTGDFLLLGIGASAITVGITDRFFNLTITQELLFMALLTVVYIFLWKNFIHSKVKGTTIGQSDEGIGEIGVVIEPITELEEGKVEFKRPVVGSKIWLATAKEPIERGKKVKLVKIIGQIAEVEPYEGE